MANPVLKIAGALAIACIVVPPVARVAVTAAFLATSAQAQTYGTAKLSADETGDMGGPLPADAAIKRNDAPTGPSSGNASRAAAGSTQASEGAQPNGCYPGQIPLLPGSTCSPPLTDCFADRPAKHAREVPCSLRQASATSQRFSDTLPSPAVQ